MNNFSSKIIFPIIGLGSIGLVTHTVVNNKTFINYRNQELVKKLHYSSMALVSQHFQIRRTYGPQLTSSINMGQLYKYETNLNLDMKCYKGKSHLEYFANILIHSSRTTDSKLSVWPVENYSFLFDKWSVDRLDIQMKDSKSKHKMNLYESIKYENLNLNETESKSDFVYSQILKSSNLNLNFSKMCLNYLKENYPFVLYFIDKILNDEEKMSRFGKPLILQLKFNSIRPALTNNLNVSIKLMGTNKYGELIINLDKISSYRFDINNVGIMYELDEEFILKPSDLARKYQTQMQKFVNPIRDRSLYILMLKVNLSKVIEEKLLKNSHALESIGRPIEVYFDPVKNFIQNDKKNQLIINFNGPLNSAQLIVDLEKTMDCDKEKWIIIKSNLKMIWK